MRLFPLGIPNASLILTKTLRLSIREAEIQLDALRCGWMDSHPVRVDTFGELRIFQPAAVA